jgi:hypothetical protein
MNETPKPDAEPPLDCEDWRIAFEPYADNPYAALALAYHFARLKELLNGKLTDIPEAIAAIDRAIRSSVRTQRISERGPYPVLPSSSGCLNDRKRKDSPQARDKDVGHA